MLMRLPTPYAPPIQPVFTCGTAGTQQACADKTRRGRYEVLYQVPGGTQGHSPGTPMRRASPAWSVASRRTCAMTGVLLHLACHLPGCMRLTRSRAKLRARRLASEISRIRRSRFSARTTRHGIVRHGTARHGDSCLPLGGSSPRQATTCTASSAMTADADRTGGTLRTSSWQALRTTGATTMVWAEQTVSDAAA